MTPAGERLLWATRPAWTRFAEAVRDPERAQLRRLRQTLGRVVGLDGVHSLEALRRRQPVQTWETLAERTERVAAGEAHVLTRDPVLAVELSSGSTGARKVVPFTAAALEEFGAAAQAWLHDLCRAYPALRTGTQYWALSPLGPRPSHTAGGVPVGLDDSRYLGGAARRAFGEVLAVSPAVTQHDLATCRRLTREALVATPSLALLSVWSPTFLDFLADAPPGAWPNLAVISCWADGASAGAAEALSRRFPGVPLQPKGLMATEGVVSFPVHGAPGPVLALTSHLVELEEVERPGRPVRLAHEARVGAVYAPVLTTAAGLVRYRLGDLVRVVGRYGRAPCVRFEGREDGRSDRAGEKLSPAFVGGVLQAAQAELGEVWRFALLAPEAAGQAAAAAPSPERYALFVEGLGPVAPHAGAVVERLLSANPHYAYCRALGQLGALEVVQVSHGARRAEARYLARGGRAGDFKLTPLDPHTDWRRWLLATAPHEV